MNASAAGLSMPWLSPELQSEDDAGAVDVGEREGRREGRREGGERERDGDRGLDSGLQAVESCAPHVRGVLGRGAGGPALVLRLCASWAPAVASASAWASPSWASASDYLPRASLVCLAKVFTTTLDHSHQPSLFH
jgi:hypothetical protein